MSGVQRRGRGGTNLRVVCDRARAKARGHGVRRAEERVVLECQCSLGDQENGRNQSKRLRRSSPRSQMRKLFPEDTAIKGV